MLYYTSLSVYYRGPESTSVKKDKQGLGGVKVENLNLFDLVGSETLPHLRRDAAVPRLISRLFEQLSWRVGRCCLVYPRASPGGYSFIEVELATGVGPLDHGFVGGQARNGRRTSMKK